jgi:probable HAF family extracellular repeat protein
MPVYTFTTLDDPSAVGATHALGINSTGQIVGYYTDASNRASGFLYSNGTYTTVIDPSATGDTVAYGINNAGQIVGRYFDVNPNGLHGFFYSGGTFTTLDDPLGTGTVANGINNADQIVGWYEDGFPHGFLIDPTRGVFPPYFTLDDPLAITGTFATGINDLGQIVGYYFGGVGNSGTHGFVAIPNAQGVYSYITLDDPLAHRDTVPNGINNAGQIVGSYVDASNHEHGFLYSGGTFTTLDDPLATKGTLAWGINAAGQIVGEYVDASGVHGFLATLGPNPPPPAGTTADMILRGSNTSAAVMGQYEIYDIGNNAILAGYSLGQVGTDWAFVALGGSTAATPRTCCCAVPAREASRSTTSPTTILRAPPSSVPSAWTGR